MGRLKRDHSGWRTSGLWLKYQSPQVNERQPKFKKRDTRKWCRGKIGREHVWHRYQERRWSDSLWDYVSPYIHIKCIVCKKEKYAKTAKAAKYPMHLWIDHKEKGYWPVQVRVNGQYLPIESMRYEEGKYWCSGCGTYHY